MADTVTNNPFDTQQSSTTGIVNKAIDTSTAGSNVAQYTPETRSVDTATQTAAGQVNSLLSKDSPLLQRARTLATQGMAQRGLVNSSMNQGAGTAAMIDKITPIAQQDANTYNSVASENMAAKNTAAQVNTTEQNKFNLQTGQQNFTASQAATDRAFTTSERLGSQSFTSTLETAKQNFTAAQAQLDRAQQTALADKSVAAQQALQTAQQNFTAAQAALDRTQQTALQTGQQTFAASQAALDRAQQTSIADKQIQSQKDLQTSQQNFSSAQAALDRAQQTALQDDSQAAQQALQTAQQNFTAAQAELDRNQQINMQNDQQAFLEAQTKTDQAFKSAQASLDRAQQTALQNDQQDFTMALSKSQLPTNFAADLSKSVTTSINAIAADAALSGTTDGWIDPVTKKFVGGGVPAVGYIKNGAFVSGNPPAGYTAVYPSASSPKSRAIQSTLNYANTQIDWANKFYGTSVPQMSTGG